MNGEKATIFTIAHFAGSIEIHLFLFCKTKCYSGYAVLYSFASPVLLGEVYILVRVDLLAS